MSELTDFLHDSVYPRMDAAESGLLDTFSPNINGRSSRASYSLTCPNCGRPKRAFYYPGSAFINCNRRDECGEPTHLWNAIQQSTGLNNKDLLAQLCQLTGATPPQRQNADLPKGAPALAEIVKRITREALFSTPDALAYLTNERGLTTSQIEQIGIGYYPHDTYLRKALAEAGCDLLVAEEWSILQREEDRKAGKNWPMNGRIVGFWRQKDGSLRLWGRTTAKEGNPKYYFSVGTDKTQPYGWAGGSVRNPIVVEGTMDRDSLTLMGHNSLAIGGAGVNAAQAAFFAERGVREITHMIDGDRAGVRGAVSTMKNCEPLGVMVYVAQVPDGMDDPDKMRQKGQFTQIKAVIDNAIPGGEFLAQQALRAIDEGGPHLGQAIREVMHIHTQLTTANRLAYDRAFLLLGLQPIDPMASALRLAANLAEQGFNESLIARRVSDLYGLELHLPTQPSAKPQQEQVNV